MLRPASLAGGVVNPFQTANGAATFFVLSAIVAGLAKHLDATDTDPLSFLRDHPAILELGLFIIVFRIKTFFDDHRHFAESYQDKTPLRYIGFILAVISWVFWGLAAYLLSNPDKSAEMMATSIAISTMWIVVHVIEMILNRRKRPSETVTSLLREKWVLINIGYILCLVAFLGWFSPVVRHGSLLALACVLVLLLFDAASSRSFSGILERVNIP